MGTPIQLFNDWLLDTNEHQLTGPKDILNEVVNQTWLLGDMLKGKSDAQVVRGGSKITERIQLDLSDQFAFYQPNETFAPQITDTQSKIEVNWRFAHNMWAYTEHELVLNEGDRLAQYKSLRDSKRQDCKIRTFTEMEEALWTTPSTSTMETDTGTTPYSIPAFITEDGLAPSGFTTVETVNPSTKSRWRNQVSTYVTASYESQVIPAFDEMWMKVDYQSPPTMKQYIEDTKYSKFKILTDRNGKKKIVDVMRGMNDTLVNKLDAGASLNVAYHGVPIKYITQMDNLGYASTQPRYFWLNTEYLFPIYHSSRYFSEIEPLRHPNQPYTWVVHEDTWYNLFCKSRQRQGIVTAA